MTLQAYMFDSPPRRQIKTRRRPADAAQCIWITKSGHQCSYSQSDMTQHPFCTHHTKLAEGIPYHQKASDF